MSRPVRHALLMVPLLLAARPARAASLAGKWVLPVGVVEVTDGASGLLGKLLQPAKGCTALAAGAEVFRGSVIEGTFSGELRLCLAGPKCTVKETWLPALLMVDGRGQRLSGAVERGNAECHALIPGKGGVVLHKLVPGRPHADARAHLDSKAVARAQALLAAGQQQLELGNPEAARTQFDAALKLAPLAEAYNGVGVTHYFRHEYPEAMQAYQQAIDADPDYGDAYYNMACICALTGKKDLAFKFLHLAARNRFHDFSQLDDDQDLESLRADPRYAALKKLAAQDSK